MAATLTPQLERAYELLSDGEWHDREKILFEISKRIPPGVAMRHAELVRQTSGKTPAPPERVKKRSTEFLIASGKRSLARSALRGSRIEHRRDDDGKVWVRDTQAPPKPAPPTEPPAKPVSVRELSPHLQRAYELLADGEWRPREQVVAEMMKKVDREQALRATERKRLDIARRRSQPNPERRLREAPEQRLIDSGARSLSIMGLISAKRIERRDVNGVVMIRLRPADYSKKNKQKKPQS